MHCYVCNIQLREGGIWCDACALYLNVWCSGVASKMEHHDNFNWNNCIDRAIPKRQSCALMTTDPFYPPTTGTISIKHKKLLHQIYDRAFFTNVQGSSTWVRTTRHIFRPPILLKIPLKRMKTSSFFSKNHVFSNFSKMKKFLAKKLHNKDGKDIFRNNIICYAFYSKFATINDFEKKNQVLCSKNPIYFFLKRDLNFSSFEKSHYVSRILWHFAFAIICW